MARARYKLWDKTSDIFTPGREMETGKSRFTAEEWKERYPWAAIDGVKVVISNATINGGVCMELDGLIDAYEKMGMVVPENATDSELLSAIEAFEDSLSAGTSNIPTAEERIAAALEFQNVLNLPDQA